MSGVAKTEGDEYSVSSVQYPVFRTEPENAILNSAYVCFTRN
jgi:hypothetical protein